jgi:flagellar biosynthesis GTPase FlhF
MKVRRYNGSSLEKIREVIQKDFGDNAVIVNTKKVSKPGLFPGSSSATYEVIAAIDEAVDAEAIRPSAGEALGTEAIEELFELQKTQYRGLRSSMQQLDAKLAELDNRMETIANRNGPLHQSSELDNIHEGWRDQLVAAVQEIAGAKSPQPIDWLEALATLIPTAGGIMFRRTPGVVPGRLCHVRPYRSWEDHNAGKAGGQVCSGTWPQCWAADH